MTTRRALLTGLGAAAASLALPLRAAGDGRRFVFVFAQGGWDPTYALLPAQGRPAVDTEPDAQVARRGDLAWVSSASRPSVDAFFERWGDRSVILNGINARSLSHEVATSRTLSGGSAESGADWATRIADGAACTLPHLVLSGPSQAGALGTAVARAGSTGQLDGLLDGSLGELADAYAGRPTLGAGAAIDRFLARRAAARADGASAVEGERFDAFRVSLARARALVDDRFELRLGDGDGLASQTAAVVDALAAGFSRCVSVAGPTGWDTHTNIRVQSDLFEALFRQLGGLVDRLADADQLDRTVVVVLSEFGRTPRLNGGGGKDHWPFTSALLCGAGLRGGRTVGGADDRFLGQGVDPATGDLAAGAPAPTTADLGATLMALADMDPGEVGTPLTGLLA